MQVELVRREQGFVLITSLVVVLILTVMAVGLYFRSNVNQQTTASDRDSTEAFYLAEAGLNYMIWALYSDSADDTLNNSIDLDGDGNIGGDAQELRDAPNQKVAATGGSGDYIAYLDVSDTNTRAVNYSDPLNPPSPVLASIAPWSGNAAPTVPAHVTLDITANAGAAPVVVANCCGAGVFPAGNGAIVWLTPGVLNGSSPTSEVDLQGAPINTSGSFSLIAYSIAYVNGRPLKMLRAKIGTVGSGFPSSLGSMTDGFQ